MTRTTTTINPVWTAIHSELFNACKDMFSVNPTTGKIEQKMDKTVKDNLRSTLVRITLSKAKKEQHQCANNSSNAASGLKQIVIWPGGKKNELKFILPNLPSYDRFFEPFVGGGSVFMGVNAKEHYINDFSPRLITLYKHIASSDKRFFHYIEAIDMSIVKAGEFAHRYQEVLANIYEQFRTDVLSKNKMMKAVSEWCETYKAEILDIIGEFTTFPCTLVQELKDYIGSGKGKFVGLKRKGRTDRGWIYQNIEAAVKGAVYKNFRYLFNNKVIERTNEPLHSALMVYIHQFAYEGQFKYDKVGNFMTSYGGTGLSKARLLKKLTYYKSENVRRHFKNAHIYNYDFEEFLLKTIPEENDFIFLDPPYDCEFSTYDGNEFNRNDLKRLANYLLTKCKSKWMMIINKTDFIYDLYNQSGIHIQEYDKKYSCNARNNKDRNVIHLLITNYDISDEGSSAVDNSVMEHRMAA